MSSRTDSVLCPTCHGEGVVGKPCPHGWHACPCDDSKTIPCEDCDGSGRRNCDWCGNDRAIIAIHDGKSYDYACMACHGEHMAEEARTRAEQRLMKQLEESK